MVASRPSSCRRASRSRSPPTSSTPSSRASTTAASPRTSPRRRARSRTCRWSGPSSRKASTRRASRRPKTASTRSPSTAATRPARTSTRGTAYFRVAPSEAEYFDAAMRAPLLRRIADDTDGRFFRANDTSKLVDAITYSGKGITVVEENELWDMPIILFLPSASWAASGCSAAKEGTRVMKRITHRAGARVRGRPRCWWTTVFAQRMGGAYDLGSYTRQRPLRRQVRVRAHELLTDAAAAAQPWAHDYPRGERHFMKIMTAVSNIDAHVEREQHHVVQRSGDVQVPGHLPRRAGLLAAERAGRARRCATTCSRAGS